MALCKNRVDIWRAPVDMRRSILATCSVSLVGTLREVGLQVCVWAECGCDISMINSARAADVLSDGSQDGNSLRLIAINCN